MQMKKLGAWSNGHFGSVWGQRRGTRCVDCPHLRLPQGWPQAGPRCPSANWPTWGHTKQRLEWTFLLPGSRWSDAVCGAPVQFVEPQWSCGPSMCRRAMECTTAAAAYCCCRLSIGRLAVSLAQCGGGACVCTPPRVPRAGNFRPLPAHPFPNPRDCSLGVLFASMLP